MKYIYSISIILTLICTNYAAEMRTWTGSNGTEIIAELIRNSRGNVTLETSSGKIIKTKLESLSSDDQDYLKSLKKKKMKTLPTAKFQTTTTHPPVAISKPSTPPADNSPLLAKASRFGIVLGETTETLEWNCKQTGINIEKDWTFKDKDAPGMIWVLQGALNGNASVKMTKVSIFKGRVFAIWILFKDSSLQNYKVLSASLETKYGKNKAGLFSAMETKSEFTALDGNQNVTISLDHDIKFSTDDTLKLSYLHNKLLLQFSEESNRRKAAKVSADL